MNASPSPCVQPPDAYRHDGFYFRFGAGLGYLSFSGSGPSGSASVSGTAFEGGYAIGGTPEDGLAVGGAFGIASTRDTFHGAPREPEGYATVTVGDLGLFADWFPDPAAGWHVGGMAGLAVLSVDDSWIANSNGIAVGGVILGGYDWWIGPQWSLGLMAWASATTSASLIDEDDVDTGYRFHALSAGIGSAFTLH